MKSFYINYGRKFFILFPIIMDILSSMLLWGIYDGSVYRKIILSIVCALLCYSPFMLIVSDEDGRQEITLDKRKSVLKLVITSVLAIVLCYSFKNFVINVMYAINGYVPDDYRDLVENIIFIENRYSILQIVALILAFGIITPIMEEIFFRKYIIGFFTRSPLWLCSVMSIVCFALSHEDLEQMFFVFPLGLLCAYSYINTGSMGIAIFAHGVVNTVGILNIPFEDYIFSPRYVIKYGERNTAALFAFFCMVIFLAVSLIIFLLLGRENALRRSKKDRDVFETIILLAGCVVFCLAKRMW